MCSRYELNASHREIAARFSLTVPPVTMPQATILRPTDRALIIGMDGAAQVLPWGLRSERDTRPLINARAETLATRPTFRPLLASSRILVPATAFFEWRKEGNGKIRMRIARHDSALFTFAGLSDGSRFTIVTCEAAGPAAAIHDRMPVILPPDAEASWLDAAIPAASAIAMLRPFAAVSVADDEPPPRQPDLFG